jgi:hypothetical protein
MITELGKRCQEMARIEDFASFKSELLGFSLTFSRHLHEQNSFHQWVPLINKIELA